MIHHVQIGVWCTNCHSLSKNRVVKLYLKQLSFNFVEKQYKSVPRSLHISHICFLIMVRFVHTHIYYDTSYGFDQTHQMHPIIPVNTVIFIGNFLPPHLPFNQFYSV